MCLRIYLTFASNFYPQAGRTVNVIRLKNLPPFAKRKEASTPSKASGPAPKKSKTSHSPGKASVDAKEKEKEKERERKEKKKEKRDKKSSSESRSKKNHDRASSRDVSVASVRPDEDIPKGVPFEGSETPFVRYQREGRTATPFRQTSGGASKLGESSSGAGFPVNHRQRIRQHLERVLPKFPLDKVFNPSGKDTFLYVIFLELLL